MNILLGQLSANGDCLYATILARQIKTDFPESRLTWAISSISKSVIDNNPDVDEVWEIPMRAPSDQVAAWHAFERGLIDAVRERRYDRIVLSQISPANFQNYDGTIRPSILRAYKRPITVPISCILEPTDVERKRVARFVEEHRLADRAGCVLFECASHSGQSYLTPDFGQSVAKSVLVSLPDHAFILSSHLPVSTTDARIIDGSKLSFRENAVLTEHCDLFVGAGSGVTVVTMTNRAKQLPTILVLDGSKSVYASFAHDLAHWGLDNSHIIEMQDASAKVVACAVMSALRSGVAEARASFHVDIEVSFDFYLQLLEENLMKKGRYIDAATALTHAAQRYGWHPQLSRFAERVVIPSLRKDVRYGTPGTQEHVDRFMNSYGLHTVRKGVTTRAGEGRLGLTAQSQRPGQMR